MSATSSPTSRRYPGHIITQARELHAVGWSPHSIAKIIHREHGMRPTYDTVRNWVDPEYNERMRAKAQRVNRVTWSKRWTFRLGGPRAKSTEYRVEFARRLHQEGVKVPAIVRVMTVVFEDPLTIDQVRAATRAQPRNDQ